VRFETQVNFASEADYRRARRVAKRAEWFLMRGFGVRGSIELALAPKDQRRAVRKRFRGATS
jgi:hypothetical protein